MEQDNQYLVEIRRYGAVVKRVQPHSFLEAIAIWKRYNRPDDPLSKPADCWVSVFINGVYQNYARMENFCRWVVVLHKKESK